MEAIRRLRWLDAFPKVNEDFFTRTMSGGVITLVSSFIMVCLFLTELRLYLSVATSHELSVDTTLGEKINIHMEVTLPHVPCGWLSIDAMDISGEVQLDVDHDIYKRRLNKAGQPLDDGQKHEVGPDPKGKPQGGEGAGSKPDPSYCGPCYGAEEKEGSCCNTCEEVREAYRKRGWALRNLEEIEQCEREGVLNAVRSQEGEGCTIWGTMQVNKVAGNIHIAPGKSYQDGSMHVHDLQAFPTLDFDFTHTIHSLSFGAPYPGRKNPLDGVKALQTSNSNPTGRTGMFQYFLKVVPTSYTNLHNVTISTNQFSVTENFRKAEVVSGRNLPGLFFFYDLSPIRVHIQQEKRPLLHFLTSVCAIVGGVFTISGLVEGILYHSDRLIRIKMQMGKFS